MTAHTAPDQSWLDALTAVLRARRRTWLAGAATVVLLGALVSLLAPALLAPSLLVGLIVGIVAVLLATALVIGLDSADVVVRGPRHVTAAGGTVSTTISRSPADVDALMALIDHHSGQGGVRVALTPASRTAGVPGARANMIAEELARRDLKVLCTDLARGRTPAIGLSDVLSGQRKLAEAVRFDEDLYLAHLAVGSEPDVALAGFANWATSLPADLEVLVAALPPLAEPGVLKAVQGVELVLVIVEVDRTERVDLIASLDAIDAAGVPAHIVLVDPALDRDAAGSTTVALLDRVPGTESPAHDHDLGVLDEPAPDEADAEAGDGDPPTAEPEAATDDEAAATAGTADGHDDDPGQAPTPAGVGGAAATGTAAAATGAAVAGTGTSSTSEPTPAPSERTAPVPASQAKDAPAPRSGAMPAGGTSAARTSPSRAGRVGKGDDIDHTAREAARMSAALHELAAEIWARDEDESS